MEALNFIRGVGSAAARYGLEEAVLLDSMVFWWRTNRANNQNFHDGRWWTFNSVRAYTKIFPWWSEKQIRRILASCVEQGALLEGCYNTEPRDRTKWYTPGDDLLELYGEAETGNSDCPNGQMDLPEEAELSAQMGEPLPCSTHEVQNEDTPLNPPKGGRRTHKYDLAEDAVPILQAYVGEDRELHRALGAFIQQRVELRAINSARAVKMLLGELDRLSEGRREDKLLLIQQSMANSWKSVFPLRKGGGGAAAGEPSAPSLVAREEVPTW